MERVSAPPTVPANLARESRGLFLRLFRLTDEPLFRDLARAAVWARDAFVDPATSVASYYWAAMNAGPGAYPHHAWWQIGWITDYLISEAELRSNGAIVFRGDFHSESGAARQLRICRGPGVGRSGDAALGRSANRIGRRGLRADGSRGREKTLCGVDERYRASGYRAVAAQRRSIDGRSRKNWTAVALRDASGKAQPVSRAPDGTIAVALPASGLAVLTLEFAEFAK